MIKFDTEKKVIRRCTAPFEVPDNNGELQVHDITVEYYSMSTKKLKEMRVALAKRLKDNPDEPPWYSEMLFERIHALPDLVNPKNNKPYKITIEFLDSIDLKNLNAIRDAIEEDGRPKAPPEK